MSLTSLRRIENNKDCLACYPVMRELRPKIEGQEEFLEQFRRQSTHGYRLLAAWRELEVVGLAGYRLLENFLYGRFIYIDDLVVSSNLRSRGLGKELIDAVREEAKREHCDRLVLDTGLANTFAQRFYFRQGLLAGGLHFVETIEA